MAEPYGRATHFQNLWKEGLWGRAITIAWGIYGAALQLRDGGIEAADPTGLIKMIPVIPIEWWFVGVLFALLIWAFEASYRVQRKSFETNSDLLVRLASPAQVAKERIATQLADDRLKMIDLVTSTSTDLLTGHAEQTGVYIPKELEALAARLSNDVTDGELWNKYMRAALAYVEKYPKQSAYSEDGDWLAARRAYIRSPEGDGLRIARDQLTRRLLSVEPA